MLNITAVTTAKPHTDSSAEPSGRERNSIEIKVMKFPGGEMHVKVQTAVPAHALELKAHITNADAIMTLLMATDALYRAYPNTPIDLYLPYVPYARQDRVANPGEALSIKVFCNLINAQNYRRVIIEDPHSDVTSALLERVMIEDPLPALCRVVENILSKNTNLALVSPDAGARKRVLKLATQLDLPVVFADKIRDTRTGTITGTEIQGNFPNCALLVIDDICDGGRTFIELAHALYAKQHSSSTSHPLFLYVTHGIFSKGLDNLLESYATVFTRHNWTHDTRAVQV